MTQSQESGMGGVSEAGERYLSDPDNLRAVVRLVEQGDDGRLAPILAQDFANFDVGNGHSRINALRMLYASVTAGAFAGHVATKAAIEAYDLPELATLPDFPNAALDAIYDFYPVRSEVSGSPHLRDHIPNLILGAGLLWTGLRLAYQWRKSIDDRSLAGHARMAQEDVRQRLAEGTMAWDVHSGAMIAMVGRGDRLAFELSRQEEIDMVQIASEPVPGPWTHLPRKARDDQIELAFHRAGLDKAGELLLFPIAPSHEFLPTEEDFDISVARLIYYIMEADRYCDAQGVPRKPITIVGCGSYSELYQTASATDQTPSPQALRFRRHLFQAKPDLFKNGDMKQPQDRLTLIDPTEIIMQHIITLADGRPITFHGNEATVTKYSRPFFDALEDAEYQPRPLDPVRVVYNTDDFRTATLACPGDIVVILDPSKKQDLLARGIPDDHILVVPDEIIKRYPHTFTAA